MYVTSSEATRYREAAKNTKLEDSNVNLLTYIARFCANAIVFHHKNGE
jgi:hypothetical protein